MYLMIAITGGSMSDIEKLRKQKARINRIWFSEEKYLKLFMWISENSLL